MRWGRRGRAAEAPSPGAADADAVPVVLTVTSPLTGELAGRLAAQVDRMSAEAPVVVDVTAIPAFDSDGAARLAGVQERLGADAVTIVGFRQAAARLTGVADAPAATTSGNGWVVRRLRNLAVVQCHDDAIACADDLETPLAAAAEESVAIVVVDLRGVPLTDLGTQALAFASSSAAIRGQELLVVNVDADAAQRLRRAGLSTTTYLAPGG